MVWWTVSLILIRFSQTFFVFFLRERHTNVGLEMTDLSYISPRDNNNPYSLPTPIMHEIQEIGDPLPIWRHGMNYFHGCNELHMGFHNFVSLLKIFILMLILML